MNTNGSRGKGTPLGRRVKSRRALLGWKQNELAVLMGVSDTTVMKWETGRAKPGREKLFKLAAVLGVTGDWLMHGDEPTSAAA